MYGFVKEKSENTHISSCEVLEIENKYNINCDDKSDNLK